MTGPQIAKLVYGLLTILCVYFIAERAMNGAWGLTLWPALIAGFCIYRLVTMEEDSD
jgi:hypothetical protein